MNLKLLFLVFTLPFFMGCKKDYVYTFKIESDVELSFNKIENSLYLMAETTEIYSHSGFIINYKAQKKGNRITLLFKDITDLGGGLAALRPAKAQIDLSDLNQDIEQEIIIKLNGVTTFGRIDLKELKIELDQESNVKVKK